MTEQNLDPYVYTGTTVLKNKLNIKNQNDLNLIETVFFRKRLSDGIPQGNLDYDHYKRIHKHIFQDVYDWAGIERTVAISKGDSLFAVPIRINPCMNNVLSSLKNENYLSNLNQSGFAKKLAHYFNELNAVHPFREGNGRTLRLFVDEVAYRAGYFIQWEKVERGFYLKASIDGFEGKGELMVQLFTDIVEINVKHTSKKVQSDSNLVSNNNIILCDNLKESIASYLDALEQYDLILNKIYGNSPTEISKDLSQQLDTSRKAIIKIALTINQDRMWQSIEKNLETSNSYVNIANIRDAVNKGMMSTIELSSLNKHIHENMKSYKKTKERIPHKI